MTRTSDLPEQAAQHTKSALNAMAQHGIPATPMNLAIWYSYFTGLNPALNHALDELLGGGGDFTAELSEEIYERYIHLAGPAGEIHEAGERLQIAIGEIMTYLGQAGREQGAYGEKLAGFSGQLTDSPAAAEVAALVGGILNETKFIIEKNQALEGRLGESVRQIDELHRNLNEVRQEAMTDALTGLANRKSFDASLSEAAELARDEGSELCLLLIDIDHFKKFNDSFGHVVGDEVLKVVGYMLKEGVKGRDVPARYGGEEFAVILPQTTLKDAVTVAEQIRETLASKKLKNKKSGKSFGTVTLSIGAARYKYGEALDDLIQRADEALYRAKSEGRNRVVAEASPDVVVDLAG